MAVRLLSWQRLCFASTGTKILKGPSIFYSLRGTRFLASNASAAGSGTDPESQRKLSNKERMKILVRDYGTTAVVFHTIISLTSLGLSYLLVSYGFDVQAAIAYLGIKQASKVATGTSTFVLAYGFHKVFAPVRLGITATATPLIVRYLRQLGWIKKPLPTVDTDQS